MHNHHKAYQSNPPKKLHKSDTVLHHIASGHSNKHQEPVKVAFNSKSEQQFPLDNDENSFNEFNY